jgi:hypothetical protein
MEFAAQVKYCSNNFGIYINNISNSSGINNISNSSDINNSSNTSDTSAAYFFIKLAISPWCPDCCMRAHVHADLRCCGQDFARGKAYWVIVPQSGKLRAVGFMNLPVPIQHIAVEFFRLELLRAIPATRPLVGAPVIFATGQPIYGVSD